jgi:hypothetical protein
MARTLAEIRNEMLTQKNSMPELAELNSNSSTAMWRLWVDFFALIIFLFEKFLDVFKSEVQAIIDTRRIGTLAWYVSVAKDFQLGDSLQEFQTGDFGYANIDPTKQIIKRASAKQSAGIVTLKVAKENASTLEPEKLNDSEKTQFIAYMDLVKFAGTRINYVSLDPDKLNIVFDVWHDGVTSNTDLQTTLQNSTKAYLKTIPFNGLVNKNELIEYLRGTKGVADVQISTLEGVQGTTTTNITREYETLAGYIILNDFQIANIYVV